MTDRARIFELKIQQLKTFASGRKEFLKIQTPKGAKLVFTSEAASALLFGNLFFNRLPTTTE